MNWSTWAWSRRPKRKFEVRRSAPTFKLYILNGEEVFFGFDPVVEHTVIIEGKQVGIFDPMGLDVVHDRPRGSAVTPPPDRLAEITDMSDLAAVLADRRRPESRLSWVDPGGGPLIVVPASSLTRWRGALVDFDPGDLDTWGDYGRACQVDGYAGSLDVGDDQALVLGDEPASTTYLPDHRLFVRWIYADSDEDVIRLIPKAVETADWEDAGTWTTSGSSRLFDSALAGDELEHDHHLTVDVAPGTYLIRAAYAEPEDATAVVLVHLAEQTLPA